MTIDLKHPDPMSATQCVENGFEWLDKTKPNWADHINLDLDRLDMTSTIMCVAGQVFDAEASEFDESSGYDVLYSVYGLTWREISALGFSSRYSSFYELEKAWRDAIAERRAS